MKERTHMQSAELLAIFIRAAKKLFKLKDRHENSYYGAPNETFPFGSAYSVCVDDDQITVVMIIPKNSR